MFKLPRSFRRSRIIRYIQSWWVRRGFTLIEVLIVVAILAILSITGLVTLSKQRTKAEDVTMKTDLSRLKTAFEDYYNDHNCYPPSTWFDGPEDVKSAVFEPYLKKMLYNKKTALPYVLEKDQTGCKWFKIYTFLNNADDPDAVPLRTLDPSTGSSLGNYGVSSSNATVSILYVPSGSASPSPAPSIIPGNTYYCYGTANTGGCTSFDNTLYNCSPSYADPNCTGSNNCASAGSCTPL